ncbi:unnamed protein product [Cyprideis torosa]|uniref:Peptidase M1 membrane alanine aminopeptidase domain-containing protein n=1 Tax=Cyprideis torosa TaxID=163714 RepID=A0A7R8WIP6_9CRUS|nr:unnamed protein product [Cyprideis torosa]CAG0894351.1 unnamed protein product [Cyprideis torosa]
MARFFLLFCAAVFLLNFFALDVHSEVPQYEKLPDQDIRPLAYDIKLLPWMDTKDWLLEGETKIIFSSENGASVLSFHFHHWPPLYFEIVFDDLDHNVTIQSVTFNDTTDQVKVQLGEELQAGGTYEMYVKYEFIMTEEPSGQGIFKREYQEFGETRENTPGWLWATYATTQLMSTYLVAIVIGKFSVLYEPSIVPVFAFALPSRIEEASVAVQSSAFILEYFGNTWLNFSYSFPEMSVVPIESHPFGAMENWGLVQFNPSLFYYLEGRDLIAQEKSVIRVVSHELAHQWFGNLVTMDWWSQLWLNEGAASFYQYFGADAYDPEGKWMDRRAVLGVQPGYYTDAFTTALPISQEVYDGSFEFAQGSIIYRKGCAIHTLLLNILGNAYFEGTTQYFKDYGYENTRNADFLNALQQAADEESLNLPTELSYIMEGYLYRSGVPLVRVTRSYEDLQESVYFRQERFLLDGDDDDGSRYFIPFRYITSGRSEESEIS